jgi:sugar lactone lactonase YvrE
MTSHPTHVALGVAVSLGLLCASAIAQPKFATPYTFTTYAGTAGAFGSTDATGASALFHNPYGVAVDKSGNVYVADTENYVVRMIAPGGVVTTYAGTAGIKGSIDGTGSAALLSNPAGVAVDSQGNVFVADSENNNIRMIAPGGVVTTYAGTKNSIGSKDGTGAAAQFFYPEGIAVDSSDNVYVADPGNDTIRMIAPGGVVTTLAGTPTVAGSSDGTGGGALFNSPEGVAVDGSGNIYVADSGNDTIRLITAGGVVTTLAGKAQFSGNGDGTGSAARFANPNGISVDGAGNIYVADTYNSVIRKVTPAGVVTTLAGSPGSFSGTSDGTGNAVRFFLPYGIAADSAGDVYVADTENCTIRYGTAPVGPSISIQPLSLTLIAGSDLVLTVGASGSPPLTYQWLFNGTPISGATRSVYVRTNVQTADAGAYTVNVTDGAANVTTSNAATLTVDPAPVSSITKQPETQTVNAGATVVFTVADSAPSTYQWQFNGVNLSDSGAISGSAGPQLVISGASAADIGDYACIVTTSGSPAQSDSAGLLVINAANPGFLVNISSRAFVGTGANILIGGFYIGGSTSRSVLIQALGPALASEGVPGTLLHPVLSIYNSSGAVIYSDTGWGSGSVLLKAAAAVYASPALQPDSADSEALLTLPPGGYTAQVSGANGATGVALCAIYQLP